MKEEIDKLIDDLKSVNKALEDKLNEIKSTSQTFRYVKYIKDIMYLSKALLELQTEFKKFTNLISDIIHEVTGLEVPKLDELKQVNILSLLKMLKK